MTPPLTRQGMHHYIVRYLSVAVGFKLAIVVGYQPTDRTFRVRVWSARAQRWSKTVLRARLDELEPLSKDEAVTHDSMIRRAAKAAAELPSGTLGGKAYWNHDREVRP